MDVFFNIAIIVVIAVAGGLVFKSWLDRQRAEKKQSAFLLDMVKKAEGQFQKLYSGTEPDKIADILGGGYSLFLNNFPYRVDNIGEALRMYEGIMKSGEKQSVFNQKISLLSDSSAIVTYNWMRAGSTGKTTHIWKMDKGRSGWRLVHDHTSQNPAPK